MPCHDAPSPSVASWRQLPPPAARAAAQPGSGTALRHTSCGARSSRVMPRWPVRLPAVILLLPSLPQRCATLCWPTSPSTSCAPSSASRCALLHVRFSNLQCLAAAQLPLPHDAHGPCLSCRVDCKAGTEWVTAAPGLPVVHLLDACPPPRPPNGTNPSRAYSPAVCPPAHLQWQEAGGWAGSDWAAAAAQRASDGVAALAHLHDSYLLCRDPVLSLKLAAGLWGLSVLGFYLRCGHVGACTWSGLLLTRVAAAGCGSGAGDLRGCRRVGRMRAALLSISAACGHCAAPWPPVHPLTCLQHLEPGGPWLCGGLHHPRPLHQVRCGRGRAEPACMRAAE